MASSSAPTSIAVARHAGVSQATVSRVLAGNPKVDPKLRERVQRSAKALAYKPHPLARGLRGGRTETVGMIWPSRRRDQTGRMLSELTVRMEQRGHLILPIEAPAQTEPLRRALDKLAGYGVGAVVLFDRSLQQAAKPELVDAIQQFPNVLVLTQSQAEGLGYDTIRYDQDSAYQQLAKVWCEAERRIAFLGNLMGNQQKFDSLAKAVADHGDGTKLQQIDLPNTQRDAVSATYAAMKCFEAGALPFNALACSNDEVALATLNWAHRHGLRVPRDLAIAGYDDTLICRGVDPALTTIDVRHQDVLELIEGWLVQRLNLEPESATRFPKQQPVVVQQRLVWRGSAGPLPPNFELPDPHYHDTDPFA